MTLSLKPASRNHPQLPWLTLQGEGWAAGLRTARTKRPLATGVGWHLPGETGTDIPFLRTAASAPPPSVVTLTQTLQGASEEGAAPGGSIPGVRLGVTHVSGTGHKTGRDSSIPRP